MLVGVLVFVTIALCISLGFLLFGSNRGSASVSARQNLDAAAKGRATAEAELDKRRKELDESRAQIAELKDQLKQAKRKLFEQRESEKDERGLAKARSDEERHAAAQLEVVRSELAAALAEVERLRAEIRPDRQRKPAVPPVSVPTPPEPQAPTASAATAAQVPRRFRELSDADRERIQRLEQQSAKDRGRALELERESKRLRGRMETQHRIYVVTKGELDLIKDKFKALEKRLNRTLLERDLLRRAIQDMERKSGILAERTELTAEEIADSDRRVEEKAIAEATAEANRRAHDRPEPGLETEVDQDAATRTT